MKIIKMKIISIIIIFIITFTYCRSLINNDNVNKNLYIPHECINPFFISSDNNDSDDPQQQYNQKFIQQYLLPNKQIYFMLKKYFHKYYNHNKPLIINIGHGSTATKTTTKALYDNQKDAIHIHWSDIKINKLNKCYKIYNKLLQKQLEFLNYLSINYDARRKKQKRVLTSSSNLSSKRKNGKVKTNKLTNSKRHDRNDGNSGLSVSNTSYDSSSSNSIYSTRDGKNSSNSSTSSNSSDDSIVGSNKSRRNKLQKYQSTLQHHNISLKSKQYHHPLVFHNNSTIDYNTFDNNNNNNDNDSSTTTMFKNSSSKSISDFKYHPNYNNSNSSTNYDYSYDLLSSFMNEDDDYNHDNDNDDRDDYLKYFEKVIAAWVDCNLKSISDEPWLV